MMEIIKVSRTHAVCKGMMPLGGAVVSSVPNSLVLSSPSKALDLVRVSHGICRRPRLRSRLPLVEKIVLRGMQGVERNVVFTWMVRFTRNVVLIRAADAL